MDVQLRIDEWKRNGLRPTRTIAGVTEWNDLCVVDSFSGPTMPCRWLKYNPEKQTAWLSGTLGDETMKHIPETIIFLHGKESTPETSSSARAVRDHFCNDHVLVPDYRPLERNHEQIEEYLKDYLSDKPGSILVGISLGGYWVYRMTCIMRGIRGCIMLNPSFRCYPEVPIPEPPDGMLIAVAVNLDDDVVDPGDAINRFKDRGHVRIFEKGGHRFENRDEMLREIEKAVIHYSTFLDERDE